MRIRKPTPIALLRARRWAMPKATPTAMPKAMPKATDTASPRSLRPRRIGLADPLRRSGRPHRPAARAGSTGGRDQVRHPMTQEPPSRAAPPEHPPSAIAHILTDLGFDETAQARLAILVARLGEAQVRLNLVAPETLARVWHRHVLDSAQLLPILTRARPALDGAGSDRPLVDLGTGGGFPLLVLAAALAPSSVSPGPDQSDAVLGPQLIAIEADSRKTAFLRLTAAAMGVRVTVRTERLEASGSWPGAHVTARALAPLERLLAWVDALAGSQARAILLKGARWQEEVADARRAWRFDLTVHESLTLPEARVLEIQAIERR